MLGYVCRNFFIFNPTRFRPYKT